jgi:hypothetical protein
MKKIKLLLTMLLMVFYSFAFSQPINMMFKNKADSLRNDGNLKDAIIEYNKLHIQNPNDKIILYNYACALSLFSQSDSCFKYLYLYLKLDTTISILIDPDFCPIRRDKQWNDFENKLISQLNVKYKNPYKNIEFAKKIWRMRALDQFCFSEIGIAIRKTGQNSSVVRGIWECKFIINEQNQKELDELISQNGWPRIKDVGKDAANAAFTIILHSNSTLINKYLPTIKQICTEKELTWERYAAIYDRALWYEKKPQKYGTQTQYNETTHKEELYPLENEAKIDEWRKELGLEPLKDYLSKMNIKYEPKNK